MYDQQQSSPPYTSQGGYPPNYPPPAPPRKSTNGLAVAGFILAFLMAPIGLILSIVGLIQAGRRQQKGKGLAIGGVVVSLLSIISVTVAVVALGSAASTLADPGCTTGKAAVLDNQAKLSDPSDVEGMKAGLQATITGLIDAAAKAKHENVRNAAKALADDYTQLLNALTAAAAPDANLTGKIETDGRTFDSLCSLG